MNVRSHGGKPGLPAACHGEPRWTRGPGEPGPDLAPALAPPTANSSICAARATPTAGPSWSIATRAWLPRSRSRSGLPIEEAKDVTQSTFVALLESGTRIRDTERVSVLVGDRRAATGLDRAASARTRTFSSTNFPRVFDYLREAWEDLADLQSALQDPRRSLPGDCWRRSTWIRRARPTPRCRLTRLGSGGRDHGPHPGPAAWPNCASYSRPVGPWHHLISTARQRPEMTPDFRRLADYVDGRLDGPEHAATRTAVRASARDQCRRASVGAG